jgi:Domain of unknown function (DUF4114)
MIDFTTGTFTVDADGKVNVDYLFDGGWFRGELAVFSLEGMEQFAPHSTAFMLEAGRRALTGSAQGQILIRDNLEGAKFSANLGYEANFNTDPQKYRGVNNAVYLTPGDKVGLMLVPHTTVQETVNNPQNISQFGKFPLFSIPEANLSRAIAGQFGDVNATGTIALEDTVIYQADKDYNDMILQLEGLQGNLESLTNRINSARDWRKTNIGQELIDYTNSQFYEEGVFEVDKSGKVIIDFLYDGSMYQGEVGIFSLAGMNLDDVGSEAFIEEAITRAQSNTKQGHIVVQDPQEGAKFDALLNWEEDFNTGEYQGKETFSMNPGDFFGLVLVPNGTLEEGLTAHESILSLDPLFSMVRANHNDQIQFANVQTDTVGTIVSFEDERLDNPLNQDYNDIVLAIEGVKSSIGIPAIEDVISPERNWLEEPLGMQDILTYFSDSNIVVA